MQLKYTPLLVVVRYTAIPLPSSCRTRGDGEKDEGERALSAERRRTARKQCRFDSEPVSHAIGASQLIVVVLSEPKSSRNRSNT